MSAKDESRLNNTKYGSLLNTKLKRHTSRRYLEGALYKF